MSDNIVSECKELVQESPYQASNGYLARPISMSNGRQMPEWISCRETFHQYADAGYGGSPSISAYCYAHPDIETLAEFMRRVEDMVSVNSPDLTGRSKFGRVILKDKKDAASPFSANMVWVEVDPWWKQQQMRHQLFTCFLRAALVFNRQENNFQEAIHRDKYIGPTMRALSLFLDGRTWYTGNITGWYSGFYTLCTNLDWLGLRAVLVKPPQPPAAKT